MSPGRSVSRGREEVGQLARKRHNGRDHKHIGFSLMFLASISINRPREGKEALSQEMILKFLSTMDRGKSKHTS